MSSNDFSWFSTAADLASAMTGVVALWVAYKSIKISSKSLEIQERHNQLTLKPIPFVSLADYEDMIRVKFTNDGAGPFIIKRVSVCLGNDSKNDLISWMDSPPEGIFWSSFTSLFQERALLPNNDIILLELNGDSGDRNFIKFRDDCRRKMSRLRIILEYTDIYNCKFKPYHRSLDWFARDKGTRENTEEK